MTVILENDISRVVINELGAELTSFKLKDSETEYIWQGNKTFWGRQAPVLFPIVGRLKDNKFTYKGQEYSMNQHGFARDMLFEVSEKESERVSLVLRSNDETKKRYPFDFELIISYTLTGNQLEVGYNVTTASPEIYFGIGGHPAFNVPLVPETTFEDYYFQFYPAKSRLLLPLSDGFIDINNKTLGQTNTAIQIKRELFERDATILETTEDNKFSILSDKTKRSISLSYRDFPFVGFWSPYPKEAPFVCIEPWCGIADTVDSSGEIEDKFGMNYLSKDEVFNRSYVIEIN